MTDINTRANGAPPAIESELDGSPEIDGATVELIELLFFAYRDFVSDPDKILKDYGFGRAHHRVIHFVGRHPGICVAELLDILRITKQSLGRVLRQLIDTGHVRQVAGETDRRQRLLYLTQRGQDLHERLMAPQAARVRAAIAAGGLDSGSASRDLLFRLVDAGDRSHVLALLDRAAPRKTG
jgi:DNA-binding MarR family transcriptional regulator